MKRYSKPVVITLTDAELENAALDAVMTGCSCQCQCQCQKQ